MRSPSYRRSAGATGAGRSKVCQPESATKQLKRLMTYDSFQELGKGWFGRHGDAKP